VSPSPPLSLPSVIPSPAFVSKITSSFNPKAPTANITFPSGLAGLKVWFLWLIHQLWFLWLIHQEFLKSWGSVELDEFLKSWGSVELLNISQGILLLQRCVQLLPKLSKSPKYDSVLGLGTQVTTVN